MQRRFRPSLPRDVDYIDQDGAEVKGRDAIQKLLTENFQASPGVQLDLTVDEVKQLTPDVRVNRGLARVTPKKRSCRGHAGTCPSASKMEIDG